MLLSRSHQISTKEFWKFLETFGSYIQLTICRKRIDRKLILYLLVASSIKTNKEFQSSDWLLVAVINFRPNEETLFNSLNSLNRCTTWQIELIGDDKNPGYRKELQFNNMHHNLVGKKCSAYKNGKNCTVNAEPDMFCGRAGKSFFFWDC